MRVVIAGVHLPGRVFTRPDGSAMTNVHVGVQVRREPFGLVAGDAPVARWECDVEVIDGRDGHRDFRGPCVQGKRGDRFIYITWGNVGASGSFEMFRRAKLMLDRIDSATIDAATQGQGLVATVEMTDDRGGPRCARVDPPAVQWRALDRADAHVDAFNEAVRSGAYGAFSERFANDAVMRFNGIPVGPFVGRAAILDAYRSSPPDDTMTITDAQNLSATRTLVRFRWDRGATGTMTMDWASPSSGTLRELEISFDPA